MKVVRELGLERRETVRSLSTDKEIHDVDPGTRGPAFDSTYGVLAMFFTYLLSSYVGCLNH